MLASVCGVDYRGREGRLTVASGGVERAGGDDEDGHGNAERGDYMEVALAGAVGVPWVV